MVQQFFGWFFLAVALLSFLQQPLAGLAFLFWSALLLPSVDRFLEKQGWHLDVSKRLGIVIAGIVLIALSASKAELFKSETSIPSLLSNSEETSVEALVNVKGLDFSYEAPGRIKQSDKTIILSHQRSWECATEMPVDTARQEWETVFDLASKRWTDKSRTLNDCFGRTDQRWVDGISPGLFTLESDGDYVKIRSDAQNTDGSIIVKDALVVQYRPEGEFPLSIPQTVTEPYPSPSQSPQLLRETNPPQPVNEPSPSTVSSIPPEMSDETIFPLSANVKPSSNLPHEGILVAEDSKAQINVRTGPSVSFESRHYGLVGDKVLIVGSSQSSDGSTWYQIKFPTSGADGWVRKDFIRATD